MCPLKIKEGDFPTIEMSSVINEAGGSHYFIRKKDINSNELEVTIAVRISNVMDSTKTPHAYRFLLF